MRDGSLCPVDSKSTRGIKTAASQEGGDSGSLPENLKDVLRRQEGKRSRMPSNQEEEKKKKMADDKSGCGVGKGTVNSKREILMSVSEAVKHWEAADGNKSSKNFNEAQSSLSSPGKFGFRETLACSLNIAEDKEDTPLFIEDEKEDLHVNCSDQYRASLLEHDVEIETKSQEKSLKDEKEQPPPPSPTEPAEELSDVLKRYQHPRKPRCYSHSSSLPSELTKEQALAAKQQAQAKSNLFLRLTRQVRYGRRGSLQNLGRGRPNKIKLHIYDLIPAETVMQLPWGCYFPIGRCFDAVNNGLHSMGTGAYHAGVEVSV
mgnify:CR=1 FL=1